MSKSVLSTYKILKEKASNADIDESWVEWAIEMILAGNDVNSLYELAGISKPYNQFELQALTTRVLHDLQLDHSDKKLTFKKYIYFLFISNIESPENYHKILKECTNIYYELDMDIEYQNFAFLNWAIQDLSYGDIQHYWEGANRTNIYDIIKEQINIYIIKVTSEL